MRLNLNARQRSRPQPWATDRTGQIPANIERRSLLADAFSRYNAGHFGYRYTCRNNKTAFGGVAFTGCRTDRSTGNGFLATDGLAIPLALTGCAFKRDGANDRTAYAGIRVRRFAGPITITGCQVFPGLNGDGTGEVACARRSVQPPPSRTATSPSARAAATASATRPVT